MQAIFCYNKILIRYGIKNMIDVIVQYFEILHQYKLHKKIPKRFSVHNGTIFDINTHSISGSKNFIISINGNPCLVLDYIDIPYAGSYIVENKNWCELYVNSDLPIALRGEQFDLIRYLDKEPLSEEEMFHQSTVLSSRQYFLYALYFKLNKNINYRISLYHYEQNKLFNQEFIDSLKESLK